MEQYQEKPEPLTFVPSQRSHFLLTPTQSDDGDTDDSNKSYPNQEDGKDDIHASFDDGRNDSEYDINASPDGSTVHTLCKALRPIGKIYLAITEIPDPITTSDEPSHAEALKYMALKPILLLSTKNWTSLQRKHIHYRGEATNIGQAPSVYGDLKSQER